MLVGAHAFSLPPAVPCPSDGAALSAVAALREHRVRALAAAAQLGNVARVGYLVVSHCWIRAGQEERYDLHVPWRPAGRQRRCTLP